MSANDGDPGEAGEASELSGPRDRGEPPALDTLLRGERAAITVTVALASGATTFHERERLGRIGGELVVVCCALRERLDLAGRAVSHDTGPEVGAMLATESYDARLAALASFLDATADHTAMALAAADDGELIRTLRDLISAHAQAAQWLRERAAAFAASRPHDEPPHESDTNAPDTISATAPSTAEEGPIPSERRADDAETP